MPRITTAAELDHAITALVEATTQQDELAAKVTALRAIVEPAVRARITKADRWTRERLGVLTWQVGKPAPGVIDPQALAEHLVDYLPDEVEVTVKIRAVDLDVAQEALEMAGLRHLGITTTPRPAYVAEMLKGVTLQEETVDGAKQWVAVDRETGEVIPGVGEVIPPARMVLNVEPTLKAAHKVTASAWVETVLADTPVPLEDIAATDPLPIADTFRDDDGTSTRYIELAGLTLDDLKRACRERGLSVTGSKAALVGRIQLHDLEAKA